MFYVDLHLSLSGACVKNHHGTKEDSIEKCLGEYMKRTTFLPGGKKYKVNEIMSTNVVK